MMLPWHAHAWPSFAAQLRAKRHHAWLLYGPQGIGKWQLALAIAQARLCLSPRDDASACGHCASCVQVHSFSHPDLLFAVPAALRPERGLPAPLSEQKDDKKAKSLEILVDDMRDMVQTFGLTTHGAHGRVAVVYPAEAMNATTANTLLKTLEEPPAGTLFVLVAHDRAALLPTVRSRCLAMPAPQASADEALAWLSAQGVDGPRAARALAACGGRPLAALGMAQQGEALWQVVQMAAHGRWAQLRSIDWKQLAPAAALQMLQRWVHDVAVVKAQGAPRHFPEFAAQCRAAAAQAPWARIRHIERVLASALRHADHPVNAGLLMESVLIECEDFTSAISIASR